VELRHLRYFATVADATSVSTAALRLRITQPALSRQIRDLENHLGVRLFDRVGRRLRLTAEGQDLLRRSHALLADVDALEKHAHAIKSGTTGLVRVGATPQTIESVLAGFLPRFRRTHPTIDVQILEDGGLSLVRRLEQGDVHVALTVTGGDQLSARLLFPARVLAVASSARLPRSRATLDVAELDGQPLLVLRKDFGSRQWFDAACRLAHVTQRVALESSAAHTLVSLARSGHGIAIVPSTLRFSAHGLRAVPLLLEERSIGGWIAANWDPRRALPSYAEAFVNGLAAATSRSYPGRRFDRTAPPVPLPARRPGSARRR
jgi:LysR family cyn operon transcriptional activator